MMVTLPTRPAVRSPRPWAFPSARTFLLDNGMRVIVHDLPGQYVVSAGLLLDVPLTTETSDGEGVGQLLASTLTDGTASHPGPAFAEAIEACGAVIDATVGYSHLHAVVDVPGARLRPALRLLAEAVMEPQLTDADVDRNKRLHLAQLEQQLATGAGRANHALRRALIDPKHRASRARLGMPGALEHVTGAAVRAHHAAWLGPARSVLVISGDFDHTVLDDVIDVFGAWSNPDQGVGEHEQPTGRPSAAWLVDRPGSVQADIRWGWFTADRTDPRWADLQVATNALGGAYLSRLNRVLREEKGFSYGVSLVNSPLRMGGTTSTYGSFRNEVVGEVLDLMPGLIDVASAPIDQHEVDRARDFLVGTTPLRYATASGVTVGVLSLIGAGLDADAIPRQLAALGAVTPESATRAARELIDPTAGSLVVVGDAGMLAEP
ncbi:MAG: pitrilysin family protein, partial [Propionibacteriaceae bacterium]|nr:pitrilysin family protein [Propionibacteriaceae bacterium]